MTISSSATTHLSFASQRGELGRGSPWAKPAPDNEDRRWKAIAFGGVTLVLLSYLLFLVLFVRGQF